MAVNHSIAAHRTSKPISVRASAFSINSLLSVESRRLEQQVEDDGEVTRSNEPCHLDEEEICRNVTASGLPVSEIYDQAEIISETHRKSTSIRMSLENKPLWDVFHGVGTEMVITKSGRRMFPALKMAIGGLDPLLDYVVLMDVAPSDGYRYKYHESEWLVTGKAYPDVPLQRRTYIHPESPCSGAKWMASVVSFHKLKITNNVSDGCSQVVLNSLHKYQPRIHVIQASSTENLKREKFVTFLFPETAFMAVTAYQSEQITQLKIDNNPFAKGFRDPSPCDLERMRFMAPVGRVVGFPGKLININEQSRVYQAVGAMPRYPFEYPYRHPHFNVHHDDLGPKTAHKRDYNPRSHPDYPDRIRHSVPIMKRHCPDSEAYCYRYEPPLKVNRHRYSSVDSYTSHLPTMFHAERHKRRSDSCSPISYRSSESKMVAVTRRIEPNTCGKLCAAVEQLRSPTMHCSCSWQLRNNKNSGCVERAYSP